jgi:Protein of unknown function, DUF488
MEMPAATERRLLQRRQVRAAPVFRNWSSPVASRHRLRLPSRSCTRSATRTIRSSTSWRFCAGTGLRRWPTCARGRIPVSCRTSARNGSPAPSKAEGLGYLFLGQELGGKPQRDDPTHTRLDYQARIGEPSFQRGIRTLLDALAERRVALMCRERDPLDCHRLHLICRYLRPIDLDVRHIPPDGEVEMQQATEHRLLARTAKRQLSQAALERAYDDWWRARAR